MKTKFFTKPIMAVLVALVMLCSCFNIFKLDNSISAEANMPPNNQLNTYDKLYYYSDSSNASTFATYVLNMSIVQTVHLESLTPTLNDYVYQMYVTESYKNISNAYIIFEFSGFTLNSYDMLDSSSVSTAGYLDEIFSWWYTHNCSIMCICGQDEDLFGPIYNHFLTYTTIHVNTDTFLTFIDNILIRIANDFDDHNAVEQCTFILNDVVSTGVLTSRLQAFYFHKFFCPYFLKMYRNYMLTENLYTPAQLFDDKAINFFCRLGEDIYYDPINDISYSLNQLSGLNEVIDCEHLYGICYNNSAIDIDSDWLYDMYDLRNILNRDFDLYIYDNNFYSSSEYDYDNVYTACCKMSLLPPIKIDFLNDSPTLSNYNNYTGRSPISHKLIDSSSGGAGIGEAWMDPVEYDPNSDIYLPWHHFTVPTADELHFLYDYDGSSLS